MNAAAGPRLILKENEESCFGVAIWDSRRDAGEPEVSKQHVKPSTGSCEQFLFSPLLQAMQKKKKKESHTDRHTCLHSCVPSGSRSCTLVTGWLSGAFAAAVPASLKRLSRGLLACRWCWVTRARACRTQMEARWVAAAWTLTKKHNATARAGIQAGRVPGSLQSRAEELKWTGNCERCSKRPSV